MHLADLTLHEPTELAIAFQLLRDLAPPARILAGGTDLLVDLKTGRAHADHLVSLHRIPGLAAIETRPAHGVHAGLRIGALTTIAQLEHAPLLRGPHAIIRDAARQMAAPQVRNAATVGGNLASAVPCADLPPVLGVLDAVVVLASTLRSRTVHVSEFFAGPRQTVIQTGEILTAIELPPPPPYCGAAYERLALRDGNAIAVAAVAAALWLDTAGAIAGIRLMLGAVAPIPQPVIQAEAALIGARLPAAAERAALLAMAAADPISDLRASAAYRREMVGILTHRAVTTAYQRALEMQS
jgi:aerobic carbon-monoxide dehydrogenase medium subunit